MKGVLLLIVCAVSLTKAQKYNICAYPGEVGQCDLLDRGNTRARCVVVQDSVDCALKIKKKEADLGSFFPEQALLASNFLNEDSGIVAEIRDVNALNRSHSYQTVVLVKNSVNGLNDMQGKQYCHPGFNYEELMTVRAKKEFENVITKVTDSCDDSRTILEKEIEKLSNTFQKACRPGTWTKNPELDKMLKNDYSNLCELCDNPSTCSNYDNKDTNINALQCLTDKDADVAYTTVNAVEEFFRDKQSRKAEYKLLCRNGDKRDITLDNYKDCTWRNQPWSVLIGRKEIVQVLQNNLNEWIEPQYNIKPSPFDSARGSSDWTTALRKMISTYGEQSRFYIQRNSAGPKDYFQNNQQIPVSTVSGKCNMRWCTVSEKENEMCSWLTYANDNMGIKPQINCVQKNNVLECIDGISKNEADLMSIDSHYGFIARKKGLRNLLYVEDKANNVSKIVAYVQKNSDIETVNQLKDKKVCFPEYQGIAWLAFIQVATERKVIPTDCDYGKSISQFFSGACAPGVSDSFHVRSQATDVNKLCSLCKDGNGADYCGSDNNNIYYGSNGTMKCLQDNAADVAFVEYNSLTDDERQVGKILCKTGPGIPYISETEENCPFAVITNSEMISTPNNKGNKDFLNALFAMDEVFGNAGQKYQTMAMFKQFDGVDNLMFKSNSIGLASENTKSNYVQNYKKLFKTVEDCTNSASSFSISALLLTSLYLLNITIN